MIAQGDIKSMPIFNQVTVEKQEQNGKNLSSSLCPPPGSILKIAPNATLIDLKKIKEKQNFNKPIRIEEVTVIIDEKDRVKVIDYGPKDYNAKNFELKVKKDLKSKQKFNSPLLDEGALGNNYNTPSEPEFQDYQDSSLGTTLERMRQLRIDCNAAVVDSSRRKYVYAHRSVLVARSPYFYRQMYLRRKKHKCLYEFSRFTLPIEVDFEAVEAVISYLYTGSLQILLSAKASAVQELLTLFEMKDSLEIFNQEIINRAEEAKIDVKEEPVDVEIGVMVMPFHDDETTPVIEVNEGRTDFDRKRRKRTMDIEGGEDYKGRLKVSVQKIVEGALNPFLGKLNDLFNSSSTSFQVNDTSQSVITLWHPDILLTKIFSQSDLRTFFSNIMGEILEKNIVQVKVQNSSEPSAYTVETFYTQTGNPLIDNSYIKPYLGNSNDEFEQSSLSNNSQKGSQNHLESKDMPKFVHLVAMYRFHVLVKGKVDKKDKTVLSKETLIPSLLETDIIQDNSNNVNNDIADLVKRITQDDPPVSGDISLTESNFQHVSLDLKRRIVADLELYVNPSFHEEMVMHLLIEHMNDHNILPFTLGIFLAKGCNFCRKKECKAEDLTVPITPDNPVCPDRKCIKKNLQCDICYKQMSTSKSLARHKYGVHDIETGEISGLFICSHCGESFTKKWKLNIHEREHEDRKLELHCRYCKKKIRGTVALKKHVAMVHEAKPQFPCEFCPKVFKRRETLSVHRRIHTGEKPFICRYCDYASETKGNLKAHSIRKHKYHTVNFSSQDSQDDIMADVQNGSIDVQTQIIADSNPHTIEEPSHVIDDSSHVIQEQSHSLIGNHSGQVIANSTSTHIINDEPRHVIPEESATNSSTDDQVMAATIVAQSLSNGSFIITSEISPAPMVP